MADDGDVAPPALITPLESGYIRIALAAALPAINWAIYATNLDQALHITALTTNQLWQGLNATLTVASVVAVILKRIKEGKDPKSSAPRIVMSKPAVADPLADLEKTVTLPPPHTKSQEQLLADYRARLKAARETASHQGP